MCIPVAPHATAPMTDIWRGGRAALGDADGMVVSTADNMADFFTKPLGPKQFFPL